VIRDFHFPGRSPVMACDAMVATSHPLATQAAIETLRAGGTAADAAVTAVAVLGVVEPAMTGIGGDCFCIVSKPGAPLWGYNGSGRAGAAVRTEALLAKGIRAIALDSIHAVTVPGAVEAWASILKAHGRFGLDRALQPARATAFRSRRASAATGRHGWRSCGPTKAPRAIFSRTGARRRSAI
jgi:gamma-glutamyltranspeptidase/glutathione hydrolase